MEIVEDKQSKNFEFELLVQFNEKKCWAMFTCLNRFIHFQDSEYNSSGRPTDTLEENTIEDPTPEGVSIYDCFR